MFRSISLISIHRYSPVPIRGATEARHHTMKAFNFRYEGFCNLLGHTYLTLWCEKSEEGVSPTCPGEKPERRSLYQCPSCVKPFVQKQGLMRHYREKHQPGFECSHPVCAYKWCRFYEYRKHLTRTHGLEDNKIDEILGVAPRRRLHRGRVVENNLPPQFSPPSVERDRQSLAEPQQRPPMLPLLAAGKDANHAPPPVIPSMAYNPRLGHADSEITTDHEDSCGIEHLAATHAPSRLISKEEFALLEEYYKIHGRFRFVHAFLYATYMIDSALRFPSVHPGGSTTADIPPNPGMLHIPALPFPAGGYHTSPVSGDPPSRLWTDDASTLTDASSWLGPVGV
jgi:hypothetical protein